MCPEPPFANQRYSASTGCLFRIACLLDQMHGDDAVNDTQHLARDQLKAGPEGVEGRMPGINPCSSLPHFR
jgi:hypothetical protein